jgi:hypothetical protein
MGGGSLITSFSKNIDKSTNRRISTSPYLLFHEPPL